MAESVKPKSMCVLLDERPNWSKLRGRSQVDACRGLEQFCQSHEVDDLTSTSPPLHGSAGEVERRLNGAKARAAPQPRPAEPRFLWIMWYHQQSFQAIWHLGVPKTVIFVGNGLHILLVQFGFVILSARDARNGTWIAKSYCKKYL